MGARCSTLAMDYAAGNGYLEVVKWLHENRSEGCTTDAMDLAAFYGNLEIVKWLHENRSEGCTTKAMDRVGSAAGNGHLEVVKWLHENRSEGCTTEAMDSASKYGKLDVVQFLHLNRSEGCDFALVYATECCQFETVKYLAENGIGLDRIQDALGADISEYCVCDYEDEVILDIKQYLHEFCQSH